MNTPSPGIIQHFWLHIQRLLSGAGGSGVRDPGPRAIGTPGFLRGALWGKAARGVRGAVPPLQPQGASRILRLASLERLRPAVAGIRLSSTWAFQPF